MAFFSIFLWIGGTIISPNLEEAGFNEFRQLINRQIEEHLKLIEENPLDAVEYFNLGLAYMAIGQHKLEINAYLETIRLNSNYPQAHFNLAMAYDIMKDGDAAIKHAKKSEFLYGRQRNHRQVRKVRRQLNIFYGKYKIAEEN